MTISKMYGTAVKKDNFLVDGNRASQRFSAAACPPCLYVFLAPVPAFSQSLCKVGEYSYPDSNIEPLQCEM